MTAFERRMAKPRVPLSSKVMAGSFFPIKKVKNVEVNHKFPWDFDFQHTYGNKFNDSLHRDMRQYFGVHNLSESMLAEVAAHRMLKSQHHKCGRCWPDGHAMGNPSSSHGVYPLHPDNDRRKGTEGGQPTRPREHGDYRRRLAQDNRPLRLHLMAASWIACFLVVVFNLQPLK